MSNTKKYFFLNSRKNVINVLPNLCLLRLALIMCVHPLHIVEVFNTSCQLLAFKTIVRSLSLIALHTRNVSLLSIGTIS